MSSTRASVGAILVFVGACSGPSTPPPQPPPAPEPVAEPTPEPAPPAPAPEPTAAETFAASCEQMLGQAQASLDALVAVEGERTLENTLERYNDMRISLHSAFGDGLLARNAHPDPAVREAARKCEQAAERFETRVYLDRRVYDALAALDTSGYDAATKYYVDTRLREFRRRGVDRDDATRKRVEQIDERLTVLSQEFTKNVNEGQLYIEVDGVAALAGLPPDYVASHQPGDDGKIRISTNYADYFPYMDYAESEEYRKQLFTKARSVAGEANHAVLMEMLTLRNEKAKLLGYANYADYDTEPMMSKSGANVQKFIDRVAKASAKRARRDYRDLLARKRKDVGKAKVVNDWEKVYYSNKIKLEKYDFDSQKVREYFPYDTVRDGLLDLTAQMYGIEYRAMPDAPVWHADVEAYDVYRDGKLIGHIFLDMHPREGKYQHAGQFPVRPGVAGRQLPVGALLTNFPKPHGDDPGLMSHDEVETFFHEFGHLVHHVLGGNQHWVDQSGVATEWDFVEAPSQMLEEWAWSHEILSRFARHYATGEVIPADLVDKMRAAKEFGLGMNVAYQMYYASFCLSFHQVDPAKLDLLAEQKRLKKKYTQFPHVEGTRRYSSFTHLDNYGSKYYTYEWSKVIAKDLFTRFDAGGLLDPELHAQYRDRILVPGGTKEAAALVADFLGRPYNFKAFERYLSK